MSVEMREWLYGVGVAMGGVALVYGIVTAEQLAVWLGLYTAIIGGTAFANVGYKGVGRRALNEDELDA